MLEKVVIKFKIYRKPNNYMDYPDFKNALAVFKDSGHPPQPLWTDRTSDCTDDRPHSPLGIKWGFKIVDAEFARQALEAFPDRVFLMTDTEAEDFWENKVNANISEEEYDLQALQGLQAAYGLMKARNKPAGELAAIEAKIDNALDPLHTERGVKKNDEKKWADFKAKKGIIIRAEPL